jgi:deoxyribonuclease-4
MFIFINSIISMNKDKFIGHHFNISKGFLSSVDYAKSLGANFMQIFLGIPQNYTRKQRSDDELYALKERLQGNNIGMVVHGIYKLNFCNPVDSYIHKTGLQNLVADLKDCEKIGALGVIVHMGKKLELDKEKAMDNYVQGIKKALSLTHATIILETGAGVGSEICSNLLELSKLYKRFTKEERQRIKFCIDTCHIFAAGYAINESIYAEVFCQYIDVLFKWKNIACIHLNDSRDHCRDCKDNHADLGKGNIGVDGLKEFIKIAVNKYHVPVVLETPCEKLTKKEQISMVREWVQNC